MRKRKRWKGHEWTVGSVLGPVERLFSNRRPSPTRVIVKAFSERIEKERLKLYSLHLQSNGPVEQKNQNLFQGIYQALPRLDKSIGTNISRLQMSGTTKATVKQLVGLPLRRCLGSIHLRHRGNWNVT